MALVIIQARMASTRFPGKALCNLAGKPLIHYTIQRAKKIKGIESIVLATSSTPENDSLVEYAVAQGIIVFRGDEDNVLERFFLIAKKYEADTIIRLTGDNPLPDYMAIGYLLKWHVKNGNDYSCMSGLPVGTGGDIFSYNGIKQSFLNRDGSLLCDHIDLHVLENQDQFKIGRIQIQAKEDLSHYRLTVDYERDHERLTALCNALGTNVYTANILNILSKAKQYNLDKELQPKSVVISKENKYTAQLVKQITYKHHIPIDTLY